MKRSRNMRGKGKGREGKTRRSTGKGEKRKLIETKIDVLNMKEY